MHVVGLPLQRDATACDWVGVQSLMSHSTQSSCPQVAVCSA